MATRSFVYQQPFNFTEVELKGEKKYFIEGFISTSDPDLSNEVVTKSAQEDIVRQCKSQIITMDVEHEEWYKDGQVVNKPQNLRIPVAKIVDAELRENGVWVKAEINSSSDRFQQIWGSIKGGFLHSFSIAFYPLKAITKNVGQQVLKFIDSLSLINVTLTGSPINPNATFSPVMKAVMHGMTIESAPALKGETMSEQPTVTPDPAPVVATPAPEVKASEPVVAAPVEVKAEAFVSAKDFDAFKKDFDAMKKDFDAMKASKKDSDADDKDKAKDENAVPAVESKDTTTALGGQNPNVKSDEVLAQIKALETENAELKAKLAEPVIKGLGPNGKPEDFAKQTQAPQIASVLSMIR